MTANNGKTEISKTFKNQNGNENMSVETLHRIWLKRRFLKAKMKCLSGAILVLMAIQLQQANAQNLVLQDTTITTIATFLANSITAGPNFTIANTGDVILSAETIAVIPRFIIINGGKLQVVSGATPVSVETDDPIIPDEFIVHQNFPNPFNPVTTIRYGLPEGSQVKLEVFNTLGQKVAELVNGYESEGYHEVIFNLGNLASGFYLYKIQANNFVETKKMVLMK